jgi:hypothetical protein
MTTRLDRIEVNLKRMARMENDYAQSKGLCRDTNYLDDQEALIRVARAVTSLTDQEGELSCVPDGPERIELENSLAQLLEEVK